ncbi:MAG: hypothetical protein OXT74_00795, partial [Candidatus Poribacteria bacterium]|nr:hypothetical protein [Candidatus Poribacteria bacterium]
MESKGSSFCLKALVVILLLLTIPSLTPAWAADSDKDLSLLASVNEVVAAVLFFDLAFGSVQIDVVNRDGSPVYDEDGNPKKRVVAVPFLVMLLIL